jgi:hypothetical protein
MTYVIRDNSVMKDGFVLVWYVEYDFGSVA